MPGSGMMPLPGATTITVWPRDFGDSTPARSPSDYGFSRLADDVEAARRHAGIARWIFWGGSMGGFTALVYALRYPDAVSGLILDSTAASHHYAYDPESIWPDVGMSQEAHLFAADPTPDHRAAFFARVRAIEAAKGGSTTPLPDDLDNNGRALGRILATLGEYDVRDRLAEIRVPTLILAGERDRQCTPRQARVLADGIPGARLHVYAGVGHGVMRANPPGLADVLREFVDRCDARF